MLGLKDAKMRNLTLLGVRFLIAIVQILIIQHLTSKYGLSFIGQYSKILFPIMLLTSMFSSGIINYNGYLLSQSPRNIIRASQLARRILVFQGIGVVISLFVINLSTSVPLGLNLIIILLYMTLSINIVIYSFLIGLKKYTRQILFQFLTVLIVYVFLVLMDSLSIQSIIVAWLLGAIAVVLGNLKLFRFVLLAEKTNSSFVADVKILWASFSSDASTYVIQRGDFLVLQMIPVSDNVLGLYYFFLQIMEGMMHVAKALSPVILREYISNKKSSILLVVFALSVVLIGCVAAVMFWDFWVIYFSKEMLVYKSLFIIWTFVLVLTNALYLFRNILYAFGGFDMAFYINAIGVAFVAGYILLFPLEDITSLSNFFKFKSGVFFVLIGFILLVIRTRSIRKKNSAIG